MEHKSTAIHFAQWLAEWHFRLNNIDSESKIYYWTSESMLAKYTTEELYDKFLESTNA